MLRIGAVIPARMDSTRLPGKALTPVLGRPLLDYVVERARRISGIAEVVLATTDRDVDAPLASYAARQGIPAWRGELEDVAARFLGCAQGRKYDAFLRLNGDSPFPDPALWAEGLELFGRGEADLVSNLPGRSYPYGIAVEVVRTSSFERLCAEMEGDEDRQHVTKRFYAKPEGWRILGMSSRHPDLKTARLTVDTPEDLRNFASLAAHLADNVLTAGYAEVARAALDLFPAENSR